MKLTCTHCGTVSEDHIMNMNWYVYSPPWKCVSCSRDFYAPDTEEFMGADIGVLSSMANPSAEELRDKCIELNEENIALQRRVEELEAT